MRGFDVIHSRSYVALARRPVLSSRRSVSEEGRTITRAPITNLVARCLRARSPSALAITVAACPSLGRHHTGLLHPVHCVRHRARPESRRDRHPHHQQRSAYHRARCPHRPWRPLPAAPANAPHSTAHGPDLGGVLFNRINRPDERAHKHRAAFYKADLSKEMEWGVWTPSWRPLHKASGWLAALLPAPCSNPLTLSSPTCPPWPLVCGLPACPWCVCWMVG